MIVILIITMFSLGNCLEQLIHNDINDEIRAIIGKYISKIPDIKSQYVINDGLSKVINHYFKGKITTLPLYKISLTIDRNPVKIPWTLNAVDDQQEDVIQRALDEQLDKNVKQRQYSIVKSNRRPKKLTRTTTTTEASDTTETTDATESADTTETTDTTPATLLTTLVTKITTPEPQ